MISTFNNFAELRSHKIQTKPIFYVEHVFEKMCSTWSKVGFSVELDHTSSLTDHQHPLPEAHLRAITQGAAT